MTGRQAFNSILCLCTILIGGAVATQMECPEINENSTFGELSMAWNCDLMKWRNAFAGLKLRVEQDCNVTDADDHWRSVFECPDFSDINCTDGTPTLNDTDSFNCTVIYCENGNYPDDVFLRKIWLHHFRANGKFMLAYKNNLTHCLRSAGSTINTYMTECPYVDINSTSAEMSVAWMCEFINWRHIFAEWKTAVENDCSVNSTEPEWQATFKCPDFSEVDCEDKEPPQNDTDSLSCPINFCRSGEYTDATILHIISGAQLDAYQSAISIASNSNLTCAPRKYPDAFTTVGVSKSVTTPTVNPTEVATESTAEESTNRSASTSSVDQDVSTEFNTLTQGATESNKEESTAVSAGFSPTPEPATIVASVTSADEVISTVSMSTDLGVVQSQTVTASESTSTMEGATATTTNRDVDGVISASNPTAIADTATTRDGASSTESTATDSEGVTELLHESATADDSTPASEPAKISDTVSSATAPTSVETLSTVSGSIGTITPHSDSTGSAK